MAVQLLTEAEVADQLRVSTRTLQHWRKKSLGPQFVDVGVNTIRYSQDDIAAYVKSRATGGEIPERALHVMRRALETLMLLHGWKPAIGARGVIETVANELRDMVEPNMEQH